MQALAWFVIGFAVGSLPFSLWIGRLALRVDIRSLGDGNPGGYNVWRAGGRGWAALAVLLDGLKGAIPVGLAYQVYDVQGWALLPVVLAPLLGHIFSPLLKFRGGKGLATTFGIWLGLTLWLGPVVLGLSLFGWRRLLKSDGAAVIAGMVTLTIALVLSGAGIDLAVICLANIVPLGWAYARVPAEGGPRSGM
jgi:glycerol-3-phosphate acyltransferase PlsY